MMKQAIFVLALLGLGFAAPQGRKLFHEHFDDFMEVIVEHAGEDLNELLEHYLEFEEFTVALQYIQTNSFRDLIFEMESLPEFIAVVDFLERDNIDIHYFIDLINQVLEIDNKKRSSRHELSGTDLTAFINDCIAAFPKDKLSALFDDKMANDPDFNATINNLQSEEWQRLFAALIENETFRKEAQTFLENGIDLHVLLEEIIAIFGQN